MLNFGSNHSRQSGFLHLFLGALAIITPGSTETLAVANVAAPAGVLTMSGSASSVQIGQAGVLPDGGAKLVWSAAPSDDLQGRVLAGLIVDGGPSGASLASNPVVINRNDVYGNGLFSTLRTTYRNATGQTLQNFQFEPSGGDPTTAVNNARALNPDAVVVKKD